jgi:hypothetical protein
MIHMHASDPVNMTPNGVAPCDARPQAKWPRWRVVLVYLVLTALASISIWLVDRSAMRVQNNSTAPAGAR